MPPSNDSIDARNDGDPMSLTNEVGNSTDLAFVNLPADGSSVSLQSPSLILQALMPVILAVSLFLFGRKFYRFTTSVSVAISFAFLVWAVFVNLETRNSIAGWSDEVAALTVWSVMVGSGLLGCLLGFQPKWWGAHLTGRLCLGANAGLGLSFSVLLLRSGLLVKSPAAQWAFVGVLAILGTTLVLYDHFIGPSLAIVLEAAFLLFLGLDLFINRASKGAAIGLRFLLDHNPNHSSFRVDYVLQKSTWILITLSWSIAFIFFCIDYSLYSSKPFGPLASTNEEIDEERGSENKSSTLDTRNGSKENNDQNKKSNDLENELATNTSQKTNSTSLDQNRSFGGQPKLSGDQSLNSYTSRVLAPPEFNGSQPALALSPNVYSRYRRTPDSASSPPSRTPIQYNPQRSNLSNFYQLRRVETVDEVTEGGTSVGDAEGTIQSSVLVSGDGGERIVRGTSLNEDYLNAVMRLAAGDDCSSHLASDLKRDEDAKEETCSTKSKILKDSQPASLPPVDTSGVTKVNGVGGKEEGKRRSLLEEPEINCSEDFHESPESPVIGPKGLSSVPEHEADENKSSKPEPVSSSNSSKSPSFEFKKLFNALPKKASQSSLGHSSRPTGSLLAANLHDDDDEDEDDEERSVAGTGVSKANGSLFSKIPRPSGPSDGGRSRGLKSANSSSSDLLSNMRHSHRHSRVKPTPPSSIITQNIGRLPRVNSLKSSFSVETRSSIPAEKGSSNSNHSHAETNPFHPLGSQTTLPGFSPLISEAQLKPENPADLYTSDQGEMNPLLWKSNKTTHSLRSSDSGRSSMVDSFLRSTGPESSAPTTPSMSLKPFLAENLPQEVSNVEDLRTTEELAQDDHSNQRKTPENFMGSVLSGKNSVNGDEGASSVVSSRRTTAVPRTPTLGNMLLRVGRNEAMDHEGRSSADETPSFGAQERPYGSEEFFDQERRGQTEESWANGTDESDRLTVRTPPSNRSTVCMTSTDHQDFTSAEDGGRSSSESEYEPDASEEMYFHPRQAHRLNAALQDWEQMSQVDTEPPREINLTPNRSSPRASNRSRSPSLRSIPIPSRDSEIVDGLDGNFDALNFSKRLSNFESRPFVGKPIAEIPWPKSHPLPPVPGSTSELQTDTQKGGTSPSSKRKRWTSTSSIFSPVGNESSFSSSNGKIFKDMLDLEKSYEKSDNNNSCSISKGSEDQEDRLAGGGDDESRGKKEGAQGIDQRMIGTSNDESFQSFEQQNTSNSLSRKDGFCSASSEISDEEEEEEEEEEKDREYKLKSKGKESYRSFFLNENNSNINNYIYETEEEEVQDKGKDGKGYEVYSSNKKIGHRGTILKNNHGSKNDGLRSKRESLIAKNQLELSQNQAGGYVTADDEQLNNNDN